MRETTLLIAITVVFLASAAGGVIAVVGIAAEVIARAKRLVKKARS